VSRLLHDRGLEDVTLKILGLPDQFIAHGSRANLLAEVGLDAEGIEGAVAEMVGEQGAVHPRAGTGTAEH
jgi:1-deoxy-D-xylulose-5-phosphate synthase